MRCWSKLISASQPNWFYMSLKQNLCSRASASRTLAHLALLLGLSCSGCGPGVDLERTVPVSGTLTYQGKPLEGYKIVFHPVEDRQGATAESRAGGAFTLGTNEPGDGAAPGKHRVSINFIAEKMEGEPGKEVFTKITPKFKIPAKYQAPETSGVEFEIPESGNASLSIDLK